MLTQGEGGPRQLEDGVALLEAVANGTDHNRASYAAAALADVYPASDERRDYWRGREGKSRQKWHAELEADRAINELEHAAETGNVERVRELLAAGVPGDTMDAGWTPLMESASRADLGVSRALLEVGADPNKAMKQAVTSRRSSTPDLLLLFIEFGSLVQKLFYEAVWSGRPKDVRVLLDKVDLNQPDPSGRSPLLLASLNSAAMVRLLLAHGSDLSRITPDKRHPLILCASRGYLKPLKALLQAGHSDDVLRTALVQACARGRFRCVRALLDAGANVNADLGTPLMAAADQGSLALVNLLLERGADPGWVDETGKTARDYALEFASADFFQKSVDEIGGKSDRHRWATDSVTGEPILQLRLGRQIYRRTNCHKAIVERLSQAVGSPG